MHKPLRWIPLASALAIVLPLAACASRTTMPPAPVTPQHPEFLFPASPQGTPPDLMTRIERGWRYLQLGAPRSASREFSDALRVQPAFHPAETGLGYLALARRDADEAVPHFDRALTAAPDYVPALVGRGQALLELKRDADALASFEAALETDPSLTDLQGRIDVLRFRLMQANLERARAASEAGRLEEARTAYAQAIGASPESAFLHREIALVERRAGRSAEALEHFRRAVTLDPGDARSHAEIGGLLAEQGDAAAALAAYEKAHSIDANEVPAGVLARAREAAAAARLPAEYRAIPASRAVTRADLAALIGIRLAPLVAQTRQRQVVVTDVRGQWAQEWILGVVRAGVMDTQPNYTFQPGVVVRRGELAQIVSRVLSLVAARNPSAAKRWTGVRPVIPDVPFGHLSYPGVAQAMAAGVMPLLPDGTFQLLRPVAGSEAVEVVGHLEALATRP